MTYSALKRFELLNYAGRSGWHKFLINSAPREVETAATGGAAATFSSNGLRLYPGGTSGDNARADAMNDGIGDYDIQGATHIRVFAWGLNYTITYPTTDIFRIGFGCVQPFEGGDEAYIDFQQDAYSVNGTSQALGFTPSTGEGYRTIIENLSGSGVRFTTYKGGQLEEQVVVGSDGVRRAQNFAYTEAAGGAAQPLTIGQLGEIVTHEQSGNDSNYA